MSRTMQRISPQQTEGFAPSLKTTVFSSLWLRCFVALTFILLFTSLTNRYIHPIYNAIYPPAQEICMFGTIATFFAAALIATFRPSWLRIFPISMAALFLYVVGLAMMGMGIYYANALLLTSGGMLSNFGSAWIRIFALIALTRLPEKECATCVAAGTIAFYVIKFLLLSSDDILGIVVFALSTVIILIASLPESQEALKYAKTSLPPATLSLTNPRMFLPFSHILFITLFVFNVACGITVTFNAVDGVPSSTLVAMLPVCIVAVWVIFSKKLYADIVYQISCLLIFAGYLTILLPQLFATSVPNVFLAAGINCFKMVMFVTLAAIGRRNPLNALAIFAWGEFAISVGILFGTIFGHATVALFASNSSTAMLVIAVALFIFFAYNLIILRTFGFEKTVQGVEEMHELIPIEEKETAGADFVDEQCKEISTFFSLTEREAIIFNYLAHGRNVPFIQEKLVISHNTVKTHIRHIYQKMDIHSQQELINLVEAF